MEHFAQMNVFARIRAVFARIRTVFAHLIIGCAIRYPKIGCLHYMQIKYSYIYTDTYTTNNYNLITKTNIIKQQQQYTKQTTAKNTIKQTKQKIN